MLSCNSLAKTILVFGDSISAGYGITQGQGWVDQLAAQLAGKHVVINASISGETSGGGLSRLPATLAKHKPDIVVLELGGNDGLRGLPTQQMYNNLQSMIGLCRAQNAEVILAGMQIPPNYGKRYSQAFAQTYQTLAKTEKVHLIPFLLDGIATHATLMQGDGIHPNDNAQSQIKNVVYDSLKTLLQQ